MDTTRYRVLSLDGGGIRGIITITLMQRLEKEIPGWLAGADMLAGTSTGGLIALGLANDESLESLRDLYVNKGPSIFKDSLWHDLTHLDRLLGAEYATTDLELELHSRLGDKTLGQLQKKVLVTAFDLDNSSPDPSMRFWKPKIFHNFVESGKPGSDSDVPAFKVGLYTSAAPTYFPSVDGFVDGGVFASNPSMCALAQTQDPRTHAAGPALSEVTLLSLGTGKPLEYIAGLTHDWGYVQWIEPLIDIMLDGVASIADYQCKQLLTERYHRLAPVFPPGVIIDMDEVQRIPEMLTFARNVDLTGTVEWIKKFWM
jgi:patatin-like phospholipase/acyl hydrolase